MGGVTNIFRSIFVAELNEGGEMSRLLAHRLVESGGELTCRHDAEEVVLPDSHLSVSREAIRCP